MSAAAKSLSNIDCSAEDSRTSIRYAPQLTGTDYRCAASRAAAQQQLKLNPPDWLRDLNESAMEYGFGPDIESMTMKEAEAYLAYVKHEEGRSNQILLCVFDAMKALIPLKLDKEKFVATVTSIVNHLGKGAYWTEDELVFDGAHQVQNLTLAVSVDLLGWVPGCAPIAAVTPSSQS